MLEEQADCSVSNIDLALLNRADEDCGEMIPALSAALLKVAEISLARSFTLTLVTSASSLSILSASPCWKLKNRVMCKTQSNS